MITIRLNKNEIDFIKTLSKDAEIGGASNVYRDHDTRMNQLSEDQLFGQLGEAALHKYWYGHLLEYSRSRWYRNRVPYIGDNGHDLMPFNIDVKCSKIRNQRLDFLGYNLIVRPNERHDGWVYVLALGELHDENSAFIHLMGWASDDMLPHHPEDTGIFSGAFVLPCKSLKELMPLKTFWVMNS